MTVPKLLLGPYVLGWWRKGLDKEQGSRGAEEEEAGKTNQFKIQNDARRLALSVGAASLRVAMPQALRCANKIQKLLPLCL